MTISSWPRAILHVDADAFFASCEQAVDPALRGRPVITGKQRRIVSAASYEAKARGITRGMRISEMKRVCPGIVLLPSDYETYSLLSCRFFAIVRRYTPDVEEYSIDECFADLTGLRRHWRMSYPQIAEKIQRTLFEELGFTFSAGLGPNKVIAKIASKWKKPAGLTVIPARDIPLFLGNLPAEKVWGIGPNTSAFLKKFGIHTALQFARTQEPWVQKNLTKPFYEIWQELRGECVHALDTEGEKTRASIQKVKTFTPPSGDRNFLHAQLSKNIENACIKARRYNLAAQKVIVFLRTQSFRDTGVEIKVFPPTAFPHQIIAAAEPFFPGLYNPAALYRATGVTLLDLVEDADAQMDLFGVSAHREKMEKVYGAVDALRERYGKHTVFLGSSFFAHAFAQHEGDRGVLPQRKMDLVKGETNRRRLRIPTLEWDIK